MQQTSSILREDDRLPDMVEIIDERELLQRFVKHADKEAFALLMKKLHGPLVYGVCRRVLRGFHDAEDAFQATFLILARKASSIRSFEHLSNWLYQVAHRTSMKAKFARTRRRQREITTEELSSAFMPQRDHLRCPFSRIGIWPPQLGRSLHGRALSGWLGGLWQLT